MDNQHVAEPFRAALSAVAPSVNLTSLAAASERLTVDLARKQMGNDVLRAMLDAKPKGAQAMVDAVIALCDAEARK